MPRPAAAAPVYQQLHYYDPFTDTESLRISMASSRGEEYWCSIPLTPEGRPRRESREAALDALMAAIDDPLHPPGEVCL